MNVASVIVDVPAMQTDRAFDYIIPEKWIHIIAPGMRVIVPFGPRSIQGFVIDVKDHTDVTKLKKIQDLLDVVPVLNDELLRLGDWLTNKTLCFKISAFQSMLPAAMKAKYNKKFILRNRNVLDIELQKMFAKHNEIDWKEVEEANLLPIVQKEVKSGSIELLYEVKEKGNKKKVRKLYPNFNEEELSLVLDGLSSTATKQREIVEYMNKINRTQGIVASDVISDLGTTSSTVKSLVEKEILIEQYEEVYRDPFAHREFKKTEPFALTPLQENAIGPILKTIEDHKHETFLLYGVTGSGKTEVYLQSIQRVLEEGKEAIVLVPEISLTPQMVNRFKGRFGDLVAVLHSGLSTGEKYDEWRKIQRKEVKVVVGARSAIFAPFENLGIIIIDEEHETSYKQEENPRYHARDIAIYRGNQHHCPVVLGSATPALESFARAKKGLYTLLEINQRMNAGKLPAVQVVDMREELRNGNRSMFSTDLFEKIQDRIEKQEQIVLFLNRRGYSSFVMCRDCGFVVQCPNCDISLTYHRSTNRMKCHYCGHEDIVPNQCPECESEHIRYFGTGTQKVEEEIIKLLPQARIIRMDVDTTSRKGAHEKLLNAFGEGKADILLGTQMIAKGLDFPNITLVGVLSADTMLHIPDFRSSEKTFQLLTQVSGRAGRHSLPGEVVIQTYTPDHYSIQLASQQDYDQFYQQEMMMRKVGSYPPFYYIALVTLSHEDLMKVVSVAEKVTEFVRARLSNKTIILGPVASPIPRMKNRYRYQCLIKYKREPKLESTLKTILEQYQKQFISEGLTISIDVNPYMMM